jgi:hypothetical protein
MALSKLGMLTPQAAPQRPFCHRLSGHLFKPPSGLVADQSTVNTVECQGPRCAAFVVLEQDGTKITGACADTVQATAILRISSLMAEMEEEEDEGDPSQEFPGGIPPEKRS